MKKLHAFFLWFILEIVTVQLVGQVALESDGGVTNLSLIAMFLTLVLPIVVVVVLYINCRSGAILGHGASVLLYSFAWTACVFIFSFGFSVWLKSNNRDSKVLRSFCADISLIIPTIIVFLPVLKPWKWFGSRNSSKIIDNIKGRILRQNNTSSDYSFSRGTSYSQMDIIDAMEGHDFEYYCADLIEKNGFRNVEVTKGSGDQGIDILAEKDGIKYGIQCKCYSSDLGNKPVQEAYAGKSIYRCQLAVVMTNRYFTPGAKEAAEATGVVLWDRDKLQSMIYSAGMY